LGNHYFKFIRQIWARLAPTIQICSCPWVLIAWEGVVEHQQRQYW
jgi:hypothetical protein